jgi:hypothetical protein
VKELLFKLRGKLSLKSLLFSNHIIASWKAESEYINRSSFSKKQIKRCSKENSRRIKSSEMKIEYEYFVEEFCVQAIFTQ